MVLNDGRRLEKFFQELRSLLLGCKKTSVRFGICGISWAVSRHSYSNHWRFISNKESFVVFILQNKRTTLFINLLHWTRPYGHTHLTEKHLQLAAELGSLGSN